MIAGQSLAPTSQSLEADSEEGQWEKDVDEIL
jgi:hypothetical protein